MRGDRLGNLFQSRSARDCAIQRLHLLDLWAPSSIHSSRFLRYIGTGVLLLYSDTPGGTGRVRCPSQKLFQSHGRGLEPPETCCSPSTKRSSNQESNLPLSPLRWSGSANEAINDIHVCNGMRVEIGANVKTAGRSVSTSAHNDS